MSVDATQPTKAELAAAARAARRAALEAEALRANLHRRKQQARERVAQMAAAHPDPDEKMERADSCR
jgi:hypothetical protein